MNYKYINNAGRDLPNEFNVVIEIPMNSDPVKYEIDKEFGIIFVDRFIQAPMFYPWNYGYIPGTLSYDGDPVDTLVLTPFPIKTGAVICCRAIGMMEMDDESGSDSKILALPIEKLYPPYKHIKSYEDLPNEEIIRIQYFFEHYKDIEQGRWAKVKGWKDINSAHSEILDCIERFIKNNKDLIQ